MRLLRVLVLASATSVFGCQSREFPGAAPIVLADAPIVTVDAALGDTFELTLHGDRTLARPEHQKVGAFLTLFLRQDEQGGRTVTFDPAFHFTTSGVPSAPAPRSTLVLVFRSNGSKLYLVSSAVRGPDLQ